MTEAYKFFGESKKQIRKRLLREEGCCWYCGDALKEHNSSLDHIQPRSLGGSSGEKNMRLACKKCNIKKGNIPAEYLVCAVRPSPHNESRLLYIWEVEPLERRLSYAQS